MDLRLPELPRPVMAFAMQPKAKGDEEKAFTALRRLQEEDPTIDVHRDPQTGEEIVAGLIADARGGDRRSHARPLRRRGHPQAAPRPYHETIKGSAKAHGRYKKQTGGRGQFGDCHIEIEPLPGGVGLRVREPDQGRGDPLGLHPRGGEGDRRDDVARRGGRLPGGGRAGARSYDGSYHSVDSSEMAFKVAGSMAFKQAMGAAKPVLLEPIMTVGVVGARGLRGRRDRRSELPAGPPAGHGAQGLDDRGPGRGADVRDALLRARSARDHRGRGEYTMELARYEEVPGPPRRTVVESAAA